MKYSDIKNKNDFFNLLGIPSKKMNYILYNRKQKGIENMYVSFSIPKKNGGMRVINAPNKELKFIQNKLANLLENQYYDSYNNHPYKDNVTHAFQKNKGIITNAKIHRNKKNILNIDLEDFFYSIHFGRVKGFFEKDSIFKVPPNVALIIAQLTCYQGSLPQGAPTSPIISNLIGRILDTRLLKICKKYKLDYTRYADDLTFSTNDMSFEQLENEIKSDIINEILNCGFNVNESKTRLQNYKLRQEVTGLTVNKKLNVRKCYYKNTRAMAHNLYKNKEFYINNKLGTINQLEGRFTFINQLDKYNNKILKNNSLDRNLLIYQKNLFSTYGLKKQTSKKHFFKHLNSREREFQKFLFYKYFYSNPQPLIATEGKTDIRYIKAALKNLYYDYPTLIKKEDGEFRFKISFLNRFQKKSVKISRLYYFLDIAPDGGDALKNIFNYYDEKNSIYPNFVKMFNNLGKGKPLNPVILLYDNEMLKKSKKPLLNFCNHINMKDVNKNRLKEDLHFHITENLYLLTHQLLNGSEENEIEDLFDQQTLSKSIKGKSFTKNQNYDQNKYFGKEIFSKYILSNYNDVNFDDFRPLLDKIVEIVESYNTIK